MKNIFDTTEIKYSLATSNDQILKAKKLCHDVYLRVGYISQPYADGMIPNELEHASKYIIALDGDEVVGTLRVTSGPPFTTLKVWEGNLFLKYINLINDAINGKAFELGALAVNKEYSCFKIAKGLYNAAYNFCIEERLEYGIISMDARALRSLEIYGWKTIRIGEPKMYFGSITVPAIMPIALQPPASTLNSYSVNEHAVKN